MVRFALVLAAAWLAAASVQAASVAPPPPPVEDYGKLPAMDFVTLSPSGQRYAFVATVNGSRRLFAATTDNKPIESDELGAMRIEGVEWAGEDHLLVHYSQTYVLSPTFSVNKTELTGVRVVDLRQHKSFSVFAGPYEKVAHYVAGSYGKAEINGHWYGYFGGVSNIFSSQGFQLYKVDLDTGDYTVAADGQTGVGGWLVDDLGEVKARLRYNHQTEKWTVLASNSGNKEIASGTSSLGRLRLLGFGRTRDSFLLSTEEGDHYVMTELPFTGGPPLARYDVDNDDGVYFDPQTRLWIGVLPAGGEAQPVMFAPDRQAKVAAAFKAFPGYVVHLDGYSNNFNQLLTFTQTADDSGTYWVVDIKAGSAVPVGMEYPSVTASSVGSVRWFSYSAADGLPIKAILTLPPGRAPKNLPVVIMPHGGPEAHDIPRFDYWAQAFASRGYAVLQPNFRGSSGLGKAFHDAGLGEWGAKMETDLSDGLAALARDSVVDPKRACIVGASYGGYAALAGVTVQQGLYRCAVSVAGVADLWGMLGNAANRGGEYTAETRYWKSFMGLAVRGESGLKQISPVSIAARADAPILLIHGTDDTVVPIDQSHSMERALRSAGKPVEMIILPKADHLLLEEPSRVAMVKASVEFVMKYNPPDPAPTGQAAAH